jgi:Ca2+/Na+ antiporter
MWMLTRFLAPHSQVSPTLLAFFLAPIASEAPEILESISLSRKGHPQSINVAFSNLVGGTLSKTTLLCAVCMPLSSGQAIDGDGG